MFLRPRFWYTSLWSTRYFICLFGLRLYVPVNNFSVMSGRSHRFPGFISTFWEVNVSCSRIQHGDLIGILCCIFISYSIAKHLNINFSILIIWIREETSDFPVID